MNGVSGSSSGAVGIEGVRYRFGTFELDGRSGELRKNGVRLRLQEQPFLVLRKLLEGSGELVSREDLHAAVWQADTFVDFDTSLNTAIKRLREALGDSADVPVFIETVPRRGYRFLAPVKVLRNGNGTVPAAEVVAPTPATAGPTMRARLNPAELSATALDTSARPTSSITNDWRAG